MTVIPYDPLQNEIEEARKIAFSGEGNKIIIPWDFVDRCLAARLSGIMISQLLGINEDVLYRACQVDHGEEFRQYKAKKRAMGYGLILLKKFQKALEGDNTMLIWESKQHGETEQPKEKDPNQSQNFTIFEMGDNGRSVKGQNPTQKPDIEQASDPEEIIDLSDRD